MDTPRLHIVLEIGLVELVTAHASHPVLQRRWSSITATISARVWACTPPVMSAQPLSCQSVACGPGTGPPAKAVRLKWAQITPTP